MAKSPDQRPLHGRERPPVRGATLPGPVEGKERITGCGPRFHFIPGGMGRPTPIGDTPVFATDTRLSTLQGLPLECPGIVSVVATPAGGGMSKLKFLISLMTEDNDYQVEQAKTAQATADKLGVDCHFVYAGNDAVTQSTQLLRVVHGDADELPNAIVFEPVGTGLPHVARVAASAGVGWVVLNRDVDYITNLRRLANAPVFSVASDQLEVGRIQARQCAALLPSGGTVLYIQGPSENPVAKQRSLGMQENKPTNIHLITLKGQWTEESAIRSVSSWLKLSTSQKVAIDLVVAQNDAMAMGVRKAFHALLPEQDAERWLEKPFLGVDAVPTTGQVWLRSGLLTATVFTPPNAAHAVELLVEAIELSRSPAEHILIPPRSLPPVEKLQPRGTSGDPSVVPS